jgi:hypothetical protein
MPRKPASTFPGRAVAPRLGVIAIGIALAWAASHEPAALTPQSAIGWGLGALTVALLARSALVLAGPLLKLLVVQWHNAMAQLRGTPKS